ncbi:centrosomal protein of 63 kDa-like [Conger conger]|uniref:centrosomal protein of 63 kDa-like n=1 Tax=Conger conger TaxID=82655 RepID=UPI002A59BB62|nr:centrosomal protein of 63 kDa-like [Conger conger]
MLRAELLARDDLVQATQLEEKQWKREAARLREQLSSQEIATRLEVEEKEGVMAAELWDLRQSVERVQQQLQSSIQQEERLREDIIQLQTGLESSHCQSQQLSDALNHTQEKLRDLEHSGKCKDNQIVTLQEKLVQQQAERSKMEAMRAETRHLRAQLRDSESTLASANRRAAQVQRELLSNTGKDTEYQVAKIQLEALRLENKNLKQLISKMESNTSLTPAGEVSGEVSGDSGQWEEESQPAETSFASEDPHGISSHVSPQAACWEQTEAQSPTPKPEDCYYPHGNSHGEEEFTAKVDRTKNTSAPMEPAVLTSPSLTRTIGGQFLREEEHRMKSLEQRFDSYIQELHRDTQRMLLKYGVCPPGEGHGPGAPEPGLNTRFTQQSVSPWDHEEPPVEPE